MFNINYTPAATINKKLNFLYFCKNLKIFQPKSANNTQDW